MLACHNRANKNPRLEWFSPKNLAVSHDDLSKLQTLEGGAWKSDVKYKTLADASEAVQAMNAWAVISRFHHPLDFGPDAAFQVALKKFCGNFNKSVQPFIRFFMAVHNENANR